MTAYLEEHQVELPSHYAEGVHDSFECSCCPAFDGAETPAQIAYLRQHYPALYQQLEPIISTVRDAIRASADLYDERTATVSEARANQN